MSNPYAVDAALVIEMSRTLGKPCRAEMHPCAATRDRVLADLRAAVRADHVSGAARRAAGYEQDPRSDVWAYWGQGWRVEIQWV